MHNAENLRVVHNPEITKKHRALGNNNYSGTWGFLDFFIVALHRGAFYTPKMRIIHSVSMALCLLAFVSGCSSRLADEEHAPSPKEIAEMRLKADQGDATAQVSLGVMYEFGRGVPKDEVEAVKWYRKAADQGNADGQNNLGNMYAYGQGVPKDEVEAVKWYRNGVWGVF